MPLNKETNQRNIKPDKLHLKIDLVSHLARADGSGK